MKMNPRNILLRKFTATFVTTSVLSMLFVLIYLSNGSETVYHQGNQFAGWFIVYAMYIGSIILIYGNIVSIVVEHLQRKWFRKHDFLYVSILCFFGLANGLFFQDTMASLYGMLAAFIYAILDKWLYKRSLVKKGVKPFFIITIAPLVICWSYLELISPPMPPFTEEAAVNYATSGEGSVTDEFPDHIGQWEGTIGHYQVVRETSAEEIGKESYIVTFNEYWKKGSESGTWTLSYKVDRQSLTLYSSQGNIPSYDIMN